MEAGGVPVELLVLDVLPVAPAAQWEHPDGGVAGHTVLVTQSPLLHTVNLPNFHGGILLQLL